MTDKEKLIEVLKLFDVITTETGIEIQQDKNLGFLDSNLPYEIKVNFDFNTDGSLKQIRINE